MRSLILVPSSGHTYPCPLTAWASSCPIHSALAPYTTSSKAAAILVKRTIQSRHLALTAFSPNRLAIQCRTSSMYALSPVSGFEIPENEILDWRSSEDDGCLIAGEILMRPVSILQRMSHQSSWLAKAGFLTPAMKPCLFRCQIVLNHGCNHKKHLHS